MKEKKTKQERKEERLAMKQALVYYKPIYFQLVLCAVDTEKSEHRDTG